MDKDKKELARVALKRQAVRVPAPFQTPVADLKKLGEQFNTQVLDLSRLRLPLDLLELIPRETAEQHCMLPVQSVKGTLVVVMADPSKTSVIEEVEFVSGLQVVAYVAPEPDVVETITAAYRERSRGETHYEGLRYNGPRPTAPTAPSALSAEWVPVREATGEESSAAPTPAKPGTREGTGRPPSSVDEAPQVVGAGATAPNPTPQAAGASKNTADGELNPKERLVAPTKAALSSSTAQPPPRRREGMGGATAEGVSPCQPEAAASSEDAPAGEFGIPDLDTTPRRASAQAPRDSELAAAVELELDEPPSVRAQPGGTVLVVEDDDAIRALLVRLLEHAGLEVVQAADGAQALEVLKGVQPVLAVVDGMLPKIHGFELVRRIRNDGRFSEVPIIIVTAAYKGWGYAEDLEALGGVQHYLEKPFDSRRFLRAVGECLGAPRHAITQAAQAQLEAAVKAIRQGNLEQAQQHLEDGLTLDPDAFQLHFQLGLVQGKRGQLYEAIARLSEAVELNPDHYSAVKNLAVVYLHAGFKRKAAQMWQRAIGIAPDEATRSSIKERLVGLL